MQLSKTICQQLFILSNYPPSATRHGNRLQMSPIYNNFLVDFLLSAHIHNLLESGRCWSLLKYVRVGVILIYVDIQAASNFGMLNLIVSANCSIFNRAGTQQPGQMPLRISNHLRLRLFSLKNNCLHLHYLPIAEK